MQSEKELTKDALLSFAEAGSDEYTQINWYKTTTSSQVATYIKDLDNLKYHNEYCPGGSQSCDVSDRITLNKATGDIKFFELELRDAGMYYYLEKPGDTGSKYEIQFDVYGKYKQIYGIFYTICLIF